MFIQENLNIKIIEVHFLVPITLLPPPVDFIGAFTTPETGFRGTFFFYFAGYYLIV